MLTASFKKRPIKVKKKNSPARRIKSAKRRIIKRMTREISNDMIVPNRGTNLSLMSKRVNMSSSNKFRVSEKSINQQSMITSYVNHGIDRGRKHRTYSAKPISNDVRRFTKTKAQEPYMIQLSPSEKKFPDSHFGKNFNNQTAPSTNFQKSFYNPYQTVTKMTDNFLNIENQPQMLANIMSRSSVRSSESSISNFTMVQNSRTQEQLQVLDQIRDKNSIANELSNIKHVDCRALLLSANHQMKKINYRLNNLISNGETHLEISRNDPTEFEILDDIPLMFKISCKGLSGPAKFIIKHRTKGKLKIHTSMKHNIPPIFRSGKFKFELLLFRQVKVPNIS